MVQRLTVETLCDVHASHDEDVAGETWTVSIAGPGQTAVAYEIELCSDDAKGLGDLADMVAELGRRADGKRKYRAKATKGSGAPQATAQDVAQDGTFPCPHCPRAFGRPNGLTRHLRAQHADAADAGAVG